ncbi:MAG: FkbM family methyltransferase [Acidobacteriaceae bacterium]
MREITLAEGFTVFGLSPDEARFMYREIFEDRCYLQKRVTLDDGDCVFDVGANIGLATMFFHRARKNVRVFSFEPNPAAGECLRANVEKHGVNASVFSCGLLDVSGTLPFTRYPANSVSSGFHADAAQDRATTQSYMINTGIAEHGAEVFSAALFRKQETLECPVRTLSEVIDEGGVERIDLLKIDVERSERQVLAGIRDYHWPRIRQLVMEFTDGVGGLNEVQEMLRTRGFTVTAEQEPLLRGTNLYNLYAVRERA